MEVGADIDNWIPDTARSAALTFSHSPPSFIDSIGEAATESAERTTESGLPSPRMAPVDRMG
jgi:hypothetical protein